MENSPITLVLGASTNPSRYSNKATKRLVEKGYEVVPYGIKQGKIDDLDIVHELPKEGIDTVTIYLNPKNQEAFYDYLIHLKPRRVIFNPGAENPELILQLKQSNIDVEIACTLVLLSTQMY